MIEQDPRYGFGWAGIQTEVLNPPAGASYSETNDFSIVLVESIGSEDIMLTGDSQSDSQQYMMSKSFPVNSDNYF